MHANSGVIKLDCGKSRPDALVLLRQFAVFAVVYPLFILL